MALRLGDSTRPEFIARGIAGDQFYNGIHPALVQGRFYQECARDLEFLGARVPKTEELFDLFYAERLFDRLPFWKEGPEWHRVLRGGMTPIILTGQTIGIDEGNGALLVDSEERTLYRGPLYKEDSDEKSKTLSAENLHPDLVRALTGHEPGSEEISGLHLIVDPEKGPQKLGIVGSEEGPIVAGLGEGIGNVLGVFREEKFKGGVYNLKEGRSLLGTPRLLGSKRVASFPEYASLIELLVDETKYLDVGDISRDRDGVLMRLNQAAVRRLARHDEELTQGYVLPVLAKRKGLDLELYANSEDFVARKKRDLFGTVAAAIPGKVKPTAVLRKPNYSVAEAEWMKKNPYRTLEEFHPGLAEVLGIEPESPLGKRTFVRVAWEDFAEEKGAEYLAFCPVIDAGKSARGENLKFVITPARDSGVDTVYGVTR